MTRKQHTRYRLDLWPQACAAQGWNPADESLRRRVTLQVTGHDSTARLTDDGLITRLFDHLKHLAKPDSLAHAIPAANTDVSVEGDACRRLLWVIEHELMPACDAVPPGPSHPRGIPARPAFADAYVQRCAIGHCRSAKVDHWRQLPSASLEKLRFTLHQRRQQRSPGYEERKTPYHRRETTRARKAAAREPQVVPRAGAAVDTGLLPF